MGRMTKRATSRIKIFWDIWYNLASFFIKIPCGKKRTKNEIDSITTQRRKDVNMVTEKTMLFIFTLFAHHQYLLSKVTNQIIERWFVTRDYKTYPKKNKGEGDRQRKRDTHKGNKRSWYICSPSRTNYKTTPRNRWWAECPKAPHHASKFPGIFDTI